MKNKYSAKNKAYFKVHRKGAMLFKHKNYSKTIHLVEMSYTWSHVIRSVGSASVLCSPIGSFGVMASA